MSEQKTYSIQVVIRRVTTEIAFVHVPVNEAVLQPPDEEGVYRLSPDKVRAAAVALGSAPETVWSIDGTPEISVNPIQMPNPAYRKPDPGETA